MSLCYNICLEKGIQLLLGQSYMFGNVIIWYVQWQKKKKKKEKKKKKKQEKKNIERTSIFISELAIRHTLFVSA